MLVYQYEQHLEVNYFGKMLKKKRFSYSIFVSFPVQPYKNS